MVTFKEKMEREELCATFGFRNRWTAMLYQWARDAGIVFDDPTVPLDEAAAIVRDFVESRGVSEYRLDGVDFAAIALALGHDEG